MKIKTWRIILYTLLAAITGCATAPKKSELDVAKEFAKSNTPIEIGGYLGARSKYIWRGETIVDNPVGEAEVNVSRKLGPFGLEGYVWGLYDTQRVSEVDIAAKLTKQVGDATIGVGAITYIDPKTRYHYDEAMASLKLPGPLDTEMALAGYLDLDREGKYGEFSLSKEIGKAVLKGTMGKNEGGRAWYGIDGTVQRGNFRIGLGLIKPEGEKPIPTLSLRFDF